MAAFGAWLLLLPVPVNLILLVSGALMGNPAAGAVLLGVGLIMPIGTVLLLTAFVVGLPASEDIRWYDLDALDRAASER